MLEWRVQKEDRSRGVFRKKVLGMEGLYIVPIHFLISYIISIYSHIFIYFILIIYLILSLLLSYLFKFKGRREGWTLEKFIYFICARKSNKQMNIIET